MQAGSRVWATVSRNKERLGTLVDIHDDIKYKYEVVMDSGKTHAFSEKEVRPVNSVAKFNEATKYDTGKVRIGLIPQEAINGIAEAFTFGAKKYDDWNWAKGFDWSRLIDSSYRHLGAFCSRENQDPESGLSHLKHLGACIAMLIAHEERKLGKDDRAKY